MTISKVSGLCTTYVWAVLAAVLSMPGLAATVIARVTDATGKPLVNAVVYAEPLAGRPVSSAARDVAIEQIDREFTPYVSVVQVGTSVTFPNRDPTRHHVYSFSPAKTFEIKLYAGDTSRGILFDKPGVAILGCNIHDWMVGYVLVSETPYFAKSDKNGTARLSDLPAGQYDLKVWHPTQRHAAAKKSQKVETNGSVDVLFSVDVASRKRKFKPPVDPISY